MRILICLLITFLCSKVLSHIKYNEYNNYKKLIVYEDACIKSTNKHILNDYQFDPY